MKFLASSNFCRAWRQLTHAHRTRLLMLVILMLIASAVEIFSIGAVLPFLGVLASPEKAFNYEIVQPIIRLLNIARPDEMLLPVTVLFCVAAAVSGVFRYALLKAQANVAYGIGADFSVRIFELALHQSYLVHISRNSSEVIAGISNKANDLIVSLLYPVVVLLSAGIMLAIVMMVLMLVDPLLTISAAVGFGSIYVALMLISKKRLVQASGAIGKEYSQVIRIAMDGLGGLRDILLDGTQDVFVRRYALAQGRLRDARAMVQVLSGAPRFFVESLGTILISFLAYWLVETSGEAISILPILGVVALASQRLVPIMQQAFSSWAGIKGGAASVSDALDLLEQTSTIKIVPYGPEPMEFQKSIVLQDVSFGYVNKDKLVLNEVNMTLPKGCRVGIVGQSGCGKSTLLDIIMGLLSPTHGKVLVDGVELTHDLTRRWQKNIAHVPQTVFLLDGSIADNIAFGVPTRDRDMRRLVDAAERAQLHDVISNWPLAYETTVGERGVQLSGGQRQRIGLARAFYKKANFIVLDEATSALDNETETGVMQAIEQLPAEITVLIVAHRTTTLKNCDLIIALGTGEVELINSYADFERIHR